MKYQIILNKLLYYIHLQLNEIFGTTDTKPVAGLTIVAVGDFGDFFQVPPVGGRPVYKEYKNAWQNFNSFWKLFKMFELNEDLR